MKPLPLVAGSVFLQLLCVGATFTTLEAYNTSLGGSEVMLGSLWLALTVPRGALAPFWSGISDRTGRKPVLIMGACATVAGSLCWAFAGGAWWMLLLSRLVDSVFSAQAPVAMSVVADSTPPERRAAGMGMIGAAVALALTIGPLVGVASERIGLANLGFVMAGLQLASLALLLLLPETRRPSASSAERPLVPMLDASARARVLAGGTAAPLLAVAFLMAASISHILSAFPLAAAAWYGWGVRQTAIGFAVSGIGGVLAQGGLVRPLVPRFGERRLLIAGLPLIAAGYGIMMLRPPPPLMYAAIAVVALGGGLATPCLQAWLSRTAGPEDQGLLLGFSQTAQTFGRGAGSFVASWLFAFAAPLPFATAAAFAIVAGVLAMRIRTD